MADGSRFPGPKMAIPETELLAGYFVTDGSGDPVAASGYHPGVASVVKSDTGDYTFTLDESYAGKVAAFDAKASELTSEMGADNSNNATPTVMLTFKDLETPAETNIVSLTCYFWFLVRRRA